MFKSSSSVSIFGSEFSNSTMHEKLSAPKLGFPAPPPTLQELTDFYIAATSDSCFTETTENMHKLHAITKVYMDGVPDNYLALVKALAFIFTKEQIMEKLNNGMSSAEVVQEFVDKIAIQ